MTFYHDSNILLDLFAKLDLTLLNKGFVLHDQEIFKPIKKSSWHPDLHGENPAQLTGKNPLYI